jgi:hypothetical protein
MIAAESPPFGFGKRCPHVGFLLERGSVKMAF